jgi:hypothetical protein
MAAVNTKTGKIARVRGFIDKRSKMSYIVLFLHKPPCGKVG